MNIRAKLVLLMGLCSLVLLPVPGLFEGQPSVSLYLFQISFAIVGSFLGIWNLVALGFKALRLSVRDTLLLLLGTVLCLASFGLGKYGGMVFFWLPGAIIGVVLLRAQLKLLNNITGLLKPSLDKEIAEMERVVGEEKKANASSGSGGEDVKEGEVVE